MGTGTTIGTDVDGGFKNDRLLVENDTQINGI